MCDKYNNNDDLVVLKGRQHYIHEVGPSIRGHVITEGPSRRDLT